MKLDGNISICAKCLYLYTLQIHITKCNVEIAWIQKESQICWRKNIKIIDSLNLIPTFQKELHHFIKKENK
jgi:hypothetical protein